MKVYYAHPFSMYGSEEEKSVISFLEMKDYSVVSPSNPDFQKRLPAIRAQYDDPNEGSHAVIDYFIDICSACNAVAFSPFSDGALSAGVVDEVQSFLKNGRPAYQILKTQKGYDLKRVFSLDAYPQLSIPETRERLMTLSPQYRAEVEQRHTLCAALVGKKPTGPQLG